MIRNRKRWLASVLTLAIALGDCGGMTISAAENAVTMESTVSENDTSAKEVPENEIGNKEDSRVLSDSSDGNAVSEEPASSLNIDAASETEETDQDTKLPALHIGQIPEGEELPAANDESFIYDLPVSFETSESLILFANYAIEIPEAEETGTLEWSILRGEKGLEPGSVNLLDEEDDWKDFETVLSSPLFIMEIIEDAESVYDRMMALAPEEAAVEDTESYDYYIRAAYYPKAGTDQRDSFYTAVTVPFLPLNDTHSDSEETRKDAADTEKIPVNDVSTDTSLSENNVDDIVNTVSENSADTKEEDLQDVLPEEQAQTENTADDIDSENTADGTNSELETISSISENSTTTDVSALAEGNEPPLEAETEGSLTLYQGTTDEETAIKERIPLAPEDTLQITAKAAPESLQADILWESSDETVATVKANEPGTATITAHAEGYARITASCRGISASAVVDVVPDKNNPDSEKLLDLSGDIRVAGFERESDDLVYNGQKITQSFRVYHKNTLLKEKTDYTLSYKNNVNAAAWNTAKAPSVTINLKGQYQGSVTLYYTIKPLDINDIDIYNTPKVSPGYEQTVNYSKKLNIPAPVLTYGKKKLALKKDFICDYTTPGENLTALPTEYKNGDLYVPGIVYSYTVNGTGNFTGSFPMQLVVLKDKKLNFSSASVKLDKKQYEYHGVPLTKSDVHITEVKISGQVLAEAMYDYTVYASGTEGAYLMLSPTPAGKTAGYSGCKKITLKLTGDRQLKDAFPSVNWKESLPFSQKTVDKNGGIFQTGSALLSYGEGSEKTMLTEGPDYTVKYGNAKKAGKVTATFTGKGRYKGTLRLTYTITPNTNIKIFMGENVKNNNGTYEVAYQKDGAVPELLLKDQDYTVLKNKTDYTIKYKNNKTPGTPMTCEIKGKGSYAGYEKTVTLTVTKADIGNCTISVPDKPYNDKPNKWQSTVTIKDVNGKKLTAGKDYDKSFTYSHTQEQSPREDTIVTVTVTGLGCYEKTITGTYRIFEKNISTLKVVIDPQEYTGEAITLTPVTDIHLYANSTDAKKKQNEISADYYEIVESEYKNNIKAGTAKVTLRGLREYGGTKTYSFKIQKKKYQINRVKGIKLDKTSLSFSLTAKEDARTLTATIIPETPDQILANSTVIWSSSNSKIATVEPAESDTQGTPQNPLTSSVIISAQKAGKVTITATSQDSNKKVKCTVEISIPRLKQAGQTIEGNVGDTYQLTFVGFENQNMDTTGIEFESDNPNVVSVDKQGLITMNKLGVSTIKVYAGGRENVQQCYVIVEGTVTDPENDSSVLVYKQAEGCTDDTPYINKMLREWEWGDRNRYDYLYIPEGTYHIDATAGGEDIFGKYKFGGIVLTENQTLIMSPEAKLKAIGNNKANSQIINVFGRSNVTISGGQIIGERNEHKGNSGEWGHGIAIFGSSNVYIKDVEISRCFGDGIYLGFYDGPNKCSSGITIKDCNLHDNRRNNLSITDVSNVTIRNCKFNNANGTDPQYGIDIEPNAGRPCKNIKIYDSTFEGNRKAAMGIMTSASDIRLEGCTLKGDFINWSGKNVVLKNTTITGSITDKTGGIKKEN